jgi:hypothetical protein
MTANEMADRNEWACCAYSKEVSAMLRQQAKEIEELKMRELTDEEIISEWIGNDRNYYNFARAILRKASEK